MFTFKLSYRLLAAVLFGLGMLVTSHAQQAGASVDTCSTQMMDGSNYVEETVCLSGNKSELDVYVETDNYGPEEYGTLNVAVAAVGSRGLLYDGNNLVLDTGRTTASDTAIASSSITPSTSTTYSLTGFYSEYQDPTANDCGYPPNCSWNYDMGGLTVEAQVYDTGIIDPLYKVTTILYAAPGNKSSDGFTNTTSNGSVTSLGHSFSNTTNVSFTEGFKPFGTGGSFTESFGVGYSTSDSTSFTETLSDSSGASLANNSAAANTVDHNQDVIFIWLNPELTVDVSGNVPVDYSISNAPDSGGNAALPDILEITVGTMKANAQGNSTVPPAYLNPQQIASSTGGAPTTVPGLAAICSHLDVTAYNAGQCTLAGQCGCTPSDFAPIVAEDLLASGYQGNPASPYPGTYSPLLLDASGASACGLPSTGTDCRYVPVPATQGGTTIEYVPLQGPQTGGSGSVVCNSFSQSDATQTTKTFSTAHSYSVGATVKAGSPVFSFSVANTLQWSDTEGVGKINGTNNATNVSLCSATTSCHENINVYEDTVYHTYVFQEPSNNSSCP